MRNFTISLTILLFSSLMALQSCSNDENLTVNKLEQNENQTQKSEQNDEIEQSTDGGEKERLCPKGSCDDGKDD